MSLEYRFNNAGTDFSCRLSCERCTAVTKKGRHCSRTICIGVPLCWQHLLTCKNLNNGVKIRDSPLACKGLFAWSRKGGDDVVFKKGDTIAVYDGEVVDAAKLQARYGDATAPYALRVGSLTIDAACKRRVGSLTNGSSKGVRKNA
jgi:hypothetical protein